MSEMADLHFDQEEDWDVCQMCGTELPPLNGVEANDFRSFCDECIEHGQHENGCDCIACVTAENINLP